jgi:hypothetical protein
MEAPPSWTAYQNPAREGGAALAWHLRAGFC